MIGPLFDGDLPLLLSMRRSGRPPEVELEATLAAADIGLREARSTSELGLLTFNSNLKLLEERKNSRSGASSHVPFGSNKRTAQLHASGGALLRIFGESI